MATASTAISSVVNLQRPNPIRICFKEAKYEFLKNLRNPMYSVSTVLFPLMFYVLFGLVMGRQMIGGVSTTVYLIPAYGTFGVMGASLFGTAASLASERGLGWLHMDGHLTYGWSSFRSFSSGQCSIPIRLEEIGWLHSLRR